jgi:hypothetical protein
MFALVRHVIDYIVGGEWTIQLKYDIGGHFWVSGPCTLVNVFGLIVAKMYEFL